MSTLRLPLIGDFVYVSRAGHLDVESKYVVTAAVEDGYHIVPEGMDPVNNTSMIKYKFASQKWVVHGAEEAFNVRIKLNPSSISLGIELPSTAHFLMERGDFDQAEKVLDEYRSISDLLAVSKREDPEREHDYSLYMSFLEYPNRLDVFDWLERNYVVDHLHLLKDAITEMASDNPEDVSSDVLEWLLGQDVDWSKYYDKPDFLAIARVISEDVIPEDRIDIFGWVARIPGFKDAAEIRGISFMRAAEENGATKILELLRTVPTKGLRR